MNSSEFRFTLDLHSSQSQVSLPVMAGDTARTLYISLTDGGAPYRIEDGYLAMLTITRPTGTFIQHFCMIEDNTNVVYKFSQNPNTAAVEGLHNCEVSLYDSTGALLSSPRFSMVVSPRVVNKYDTELDDDDRAIIDDIVIAEATRVEIDKERTEAEAARVADEAERIANEAFRVANENVRVANEAVRLADEEVRVGNESARVANESTRGARESERVESEKDRVSKETARVSAESIRIENEDTRVLNENARKSAETIRIANESKRISDENKRIAAEAQRETDRKIFMEAVGKGEILFVSADQLAVTSVNGKFGAVMLTPDDVGADPEGSAQAVQENLIAHVGNKENPHGVTAAQVGAAPAYTYGTEDVEAGGPSTEPEGSLHLVYE